MAAVASGSGVSRIDFDVAGTKAALQSSSTTARIAKLQAIDERIANHGLDGLLPALLPLLFSTHAFFEDGASRKAVRKCLSAVLASQPGPDSLAPFVAAVGQEASKPGIAASSAFVLAEWCSLLLVYIADAEGPKGKPGYGKALWDKFGAKMLVANADALERCSQPGGRHSVAHTALVLSRRGLRRLLRSDELREKVMADALATLTAKAATPIAKNAVMLGVVAGVAARLPQAKALLEKKKAVFFGFYTKEIVGSRVAVPAHLASGLSDFFESFVTLQDFEAEVVPPLEKGLLRAPEIVLDLVDPLVESLQEYTDLSNTLRSHLLKPLLSNLKSTNPAIRTSAVAAFKAVAGMCRDVSAMGGVADEIISPLKAGKLSAPEHRALHAELLEAVPYSDAVATKIVTALPAVAIKEGNEAALNAETAAMVAAATYLLDGGATPLDKAVTDAFVKGLADKKLPARKIWLHRAGDLLFAFKDSVGNAGAAKVADALVAPLLATWTEVQANPLTAAQSGLMVGAYIVCSLASSRLLDGTGGVAASTKTALKKAAISKTSLSVAPKPSFLLAPRLYTKMTSVDDLAWFSRALSGLAPELAAADEAVGSAWAQSFVYLVCAAGVKHTVAQDACATLARLYAAQPTVVAGAVVAGLWAWLRGAETSDKESAPTLARWEPARLHKVLGAVCLSQGDFFRLVDGEEAKSKGRNQAQLEQQMCSLLVLARRPLVPSASWISLCLSVGVDPGALAKQHEAALLDQVVARSSPDEPSALARSAAYGAAAELVFVAPDTMASQVVALLRQDLDPAPLRSIGPVEAAIYRTPEGTAFVDVLSGKKQGGPPDRNTKDYDTLRWEAELRAQIAEKKGQTKKLTADEAAKVKAQLKKESEIRASVGSTVARLQRGVGIVKSLVDGPPTDASLWMGPAVQALLDAMDAGACKVAGDSAPLAYLACADKITPRLGSMRPFVGVATLRAHDVGSVLPADLTQEPLEELVTRVLYRLRFAGEQRPFDTVSLLYMLPLVFLVLDRGGFGSADLDDRDAQLVLAVEFLAAHTDRFADDAIPRAQLMGALVECLRRYSQHYKMIRDCFADACRCIAPTMTADETAVLLRGCIVPETAVRATALQAVNADVDLTDLDFADEVWLACHDDDEDNAELGREIWEESGMRVDGSVPAKMLPYLHDKDAKLRGAAARAMAAACSEFPAAVDEVLARLRAQYVDLAKARVPQLDEFGMPRKTDLTDPWEARHGVGLAFKELAPMLAKDRVDDYFHFLIERGPLGDQDERVRGAMLDAALTAINTQGKPLVGRLMKTFEATLEAEDNKTSRTGDLVNEAVIIMYGALARHLGDGDSKIPVVIERLLDTLNTPSETVQFAISECLPPLVRSCGDKSSRYFEQILETLLGGKKYARQRGAAYGLAGLVLGRGVGVLKEYRIMGTLKGAAENKKDAGAREAAFLAFELLSTRLGRLFEPYVIVVVPQLLTGFGDANANVRDACLAAAKACFARLSSFGVKKILPTLLAGLEDQQWRSKKGACDLLGAMAYLDPQQLAQSLPDIIPPLTGVLNDSHKEVRSAANKSLKRFGEVISNPEIKSLVDTLLKALSDPTKYTDDALDALIGVHFVHYLDAPSLALVTRILQRGLADRGSTTKRKASQVIGSLAHLTERRDLIFHLPALIAGLKVAVVDPVPTTRATASRALGGLVEKLGEEAMPDLIPGLMQTLKSDAGAGDRLGSAQALSEVLAGLGTQRLEETLPTILGNVESPNPAVREGFMSLFIFLPVCFGNSFAAYLGKIIPPILAGLADDVESIRETALRAGRLLVKNFAVRAVDLLLPELERGLADDSYRIRLSSVELVGDLLFNLTGIDRADDDGDNDNDDGDEARGGLEVDLAKEAGASLKEVLGEDKRNRILSALYICRVDTAGAVRTAALAVWKALVSGPRTLREITPALTQLIIRRLGSANMEHKVIASNALGELIRKAGDGVLAGLLPTLEEGLQTSPDTDAKQGICLALKELISSASPDALEGHERTLIAVVRTALTDSDGQVREAAAEAFDSLQQILGKKAVDQVLPYLLSLLRDEATADNALQALLTLLTETTRSNMILPNLVPTLTASPMSTFDARALASLSKVAGPAMNRRLPAIINSLMDNMLSCADPSLREELDASLDAVVLSVDEFDGLNTVMNVLLQMLKHEDHRRRAAAARHLAAFFAQADVDYSRYNQDAVRALLISFDDGDPAVVKAAWTALNEFTRRLRKEEMDSLVVSTRQTLLHVGVAGVPLAGFELPKGIGAVLPIFLQGLMNGTAEQRTSAALAISDLVDRASEPALRPFATQITGPLIRVVSERSADVKAAVLLTLNNLLEKMPGALKPFLPQLQRTFAKSLADPGSDVLRTRAARALGTLIRYTPRVDPLVTELVAGSRTADAGVRTAMLSALYEVVSKAGANMGEASRAAVLALIDGGDGAGAGGSGGGGAAGAAEESDSGMAITNAKLLGALIKNVPTDAAMQLLRNRVVTTHFSAASVLALNAVLLESPAALLLSPLADELPDLLVQGMASRNTFIADNFILATGKYLLVSSPTSPVSPPLPPTFKPPAFEPQRRLFAALSSLIQPGQPVDSRRLALVLVRTLARMDNDAGAADRGDAGPSSSAASGTTPPVRPHLPTLVPPVFASVRDPVIPVKLAAEQAFIALFDVADEESRVFDKFLASDAGSDAMARQAGGAPQAKRAVQDYFKRVALRLGAQSRERREAEGGAGGLGLAEDEREDEKEIWSVGKVVVEGGEEGWIGDS